MNFSIPFENKTYKLTSIITVKIIGQRSGSREKTSSLLEFLKKSYLRQKLDLIDAKLSSLSFDLVSDVLLQVRENVGN